MSRFAPRRLRPGPVAEGPCASDRLAPRVDVEARREAAGVFGRRPAGLLVARNPRQENPGVGFNQVPLDADAIGVGVGEVDLAERISAHGRRPEPGRRGDRIGVHAAAVLKHDADVVLGDREALVGRPAIPMDRHRKVPGHTVAVLVQERQVVLRLRQAGLGRPAVPDRGLPGVVAARSAGDEEAPEAVLRLGQALLGCAAIPLRRQIRVGGKVEALFVGRREIVLGGREAGLGGLRQEFGGEVRIGLHAEAAQGQPRQAMARRGQAARGRLAIPAGRGVVVGLAQEARLVQHADVELKIDIAGAGVVDPGFQSARVVALGHRPPAFEIARARGRRGAQENRNRGCREKSETAFHGVRAHPASSLPGNGGRGQVAT